MRWFEASPRRATSKGHKSFIFRAASQSERTPTCTFLSRSGHNNALDLLLCNCEGFPGIRSPQVKDWLAGHQIAAESWYVGSPNLTVAETRRLERIGHAVDEFLDKVGG